VAPFFFGEEDKKGFGIKLFVENVAGGRDRKFKNGGEGMVIHCGGKKRK